MRLVGQRLVDAARAASAYGLAAAHIGEIMPVVVVCLDREAKDYATLYNPRITAVSPEAAKAEEGSVSLPGVRVEVERPIWVDVDHMTADGQRQSTRFQGFAARVAVHEIEQTQGIFFLDRVSRLKRDMALKKAKKRLG